jgi:hypothetical protein
LLLLLDLLLYLQLLWVLLTKIWILWIFRMEILLISSQRCAGTKIWL